MGMTLLKSIVLCESSRFLGLACLPALEKIAHRGRRLAASNRCLEAFDSRLDRGAEWHVLPQADQLLLQTDGARRTRKQLVEPPSDRVIQVAVAHQLVDQSPRMRFLCRKIFAEQKDLAGPSPSDQHR